MLIDTHVHLDDDKLRGEVDAVVARAQTAGVGQMVCIATTADSSDRCVALAQRFDSVFASVGIHPNSGAEAKPGDWERVLALVKSPKVVALGETGLDCHWDFTPFTMQQDYFARHLTLSRQTGLPVVIHCREAEPDMLAMLEADFAQHGPLRGVMHSFSGDQTFADACLRMGLYLSFAGMVTYKNAQNLRDVAAQVPSDRLLVETDAPYLTPEPLRGKVKKNEPVHVVHTAERLAVVRGVGFQELAEQTTANAKRLFGM
ncbi:MAG: TatD family hydrolase [Gemmatales bacterium]